MLVLLDLIESSSFSAIGSLWTTKTSSPLSLRPSIMNARLFDVVNSLHAFEQSGFTLIEAWYKDYSPLIKNNADVI